MDAKSLFDWVCQSVSQSVSLTELAYLEVEVEEEVAQEEEVDEEEEEVAQEEEEVVVEEEEEEEGGGAYPDVCC